MVLTLCWLERLSAAAPACLPGHLPRHKVPRHETLLACHSRSAIVRTGSARHGAAAGAAQQWRQFQPVCALHAAGVPGSPGRRAGRPAPRNCSSGGTAAGARMLTAPLSCIIHGYRG